MSRILAVAIFATLLVACTGITAMPAPRGTGEVVVPFAVTFSTAACVSNPPRGQPGGSGTRRTCAPLTPGTP